MSQLNPTSLWIGTPQALDQKLIPFLQKVYCQHQCGNCAPCTSIRERQFHLIEWLQPENNYTLEDLEPIFNKIAFALDDDQHFFFVLANAERLTPSCANKLLKVLEEPPTGYHFILCSAYKEALLPTIISRCIIQHYGQESQKPEHHELLQFFTNASQDFIGLYNYLEFNKFPEHQSMILLEKLLDFYLDAHNKALVNNAASLHSYKQIITLLEHQMVHPPMPGSNKLFWKNLFLQLQNIRN